jgi:predicted AlkP superfamily phosphohydrolase/phosphomutase
MDPTILIGLDGATFTTLDALMADGQMPNLRALIADGVQAGLMSTPHPLTPPAWTTLMTGRNPGGHGIYDFLKGKVDADRAFFTLNDFRGIACETIWTLISRSGGRIISLNYPMMAPPPAVEGSIIPGILSWRHLRRNVHPPELYETIKEMPGFSAKELSWDFEMETAVQNMEEAELEPWLQFHITRERHWSNIALKLMNEGTWDLAAVMFDGVDKLQHACWRFLDPRFVPDQPTPLETRLRDLCLEYFRNLDGFIGEIVRAGGPRARVFLASDHGFGPSTRILRINKWLEEQGYLHWADSSSAPAINSHFVHLDWSRTTVYTQSAASNGVHIRVRRGPDDHGVAPEEYESFRERLIEGLFSIRDPETGAPVLKDILRREDVFPGPMMSEAPDLTLVPFDHGFVSVLNAEPIVAIRDTVKGTHYPEGILVASGPGIARGQTISRQSILDIAPTLLHSLGLEVPSDFEGTVIEDVFQPEFLAVRPVEIGQPTEPPARRTPNRSDSDGGQEESSQELVLNRLRALGYVE